MQASSFQPSASSGKAWRRWLAAGGWKLAAGGWRLEAGSWRPEADSVPHLPYSSIPDGSTLQTHRHPLRLSWPTAGTQRGRADDPVR
ncbi:hypothetical protein EBL84_04665 [Marichromatium sp. AB31]|nr:hypothetical protein EBL84_04665 [Marichromatium sp. AB31]